MRRSIVFASVPLCSLVFLGLAGCDGGKDGYKAVPKGGAEVKDEGHHHEHGPNGGHLVELGKLGTEDLHAEVVFDEKTRKTTIHVLGSDAKTAYPLEKAKVVLHLEGKNEKEMTAKAAPLDGEVDGKSSRFEIDAAELPAGVKTEEDFEGHLHVDAGGKELGGSIAHDHDHDHDHDHSAEKK